MSEREVYSSESRHPVSEREISSSESRTSLSEREISSSESRHPLPEREINGNQLVAYNVAYWRRALGMTQEQLAEAMERCSRRPWSAVKVSALERSIDGTRPALVPADELINLAKVLEVPLLGLFLPPVDDGTNVRYRLGGTAHRDFGPDMDELVALLFPNSESRAANLPRFYQRVENTLGTDEVRFIRVTRGQIPAPQTAKQALEVLEQQRIALRQMTRRLSDQMDHLQSRFTTYEATQENEEGQDS